ncbi:MAG: Glutamine--fructose-6-phosphate aminotransferase [isomerizing] [Chlamydiia bacterium]|nr:Glutamine--fructose-6-phosphate aminotransferase [isomerizing] [Chlamydiia bacterium]MCH9615684.1 Glutamine--fructose-6-phosphate aminotransferase [isomerizing] [Chlamydiia bacterium]MCH9628913.1 Glutamine--fructose-6-phosphate aminotransferase [isomerizing] [Chlamydiia bacterium]
MCGIFAYIGEKDAKETCLNGLKHLEYRGYDSAGIAGLRDGKLSILKRPGKLLELQNACQSAHFDQAISHTRWATHGKPNEQNAHPHIDKRRKVAIVHNGIIENYRELDKQFSLEKHSETDSETIAALAAHFDEGDMRALAIDTFSKLSGAYALVLLHEDHPDTFVAAAHESPLAIGVNGKEIYIASDPNTFLGEDLTVYFLRDGEFAIAKPGSLELFRADGTPIQKEGKAFASDPVSISKGGYPHFMLKEIHEQAEAVQRTLYHAKAFDLTAFASITILGCGTSYHAAMIGKQLIEKHLRIPVRVSIASEFRYSDPIISPDELVIAISQSGETADTLAALRLCGKAKQTLGICNVKHSTLSREADEMLFLEAGPEVSVCSTKAFTCQIATLLSLVHEDYHTLPHAINQVLAQEAEIEKLAMQYSDYQDFLFLGRQHMYPSALEAALKLKEISYVNANAYPAGELKHGPIALVNPKMVVIGLLGHEETTEKVESNLMEVKARGAKVITFGPQGNYYMADSSIALPKVDCDLSPIPYAIATQLFAYYFAKLRGTDIDQPRNLAKSVTVE